MGRKRSKAPFWVLVLAVVLIIAVPMVLAESGCENKKIVIMGADNDKGALTEGNYGDIIKKNCPGSSVRVFAGEGYSLEEQKKIFLSQILNDLDQPDFLIINPSINTCTKMNVQTGLETAQNIADETKNDGIPKIIFLAITPRTSPIGATCVQKLNKELPRINAIFVDIYSALKNPNGAGCNLGYCNEDELQSWNKEGHKLVAQKILSALGVSLKEGEEETTLSPPAVFAGPSAAASSKGPTGPIHQNCLFNQRCQEIDEVWQRIAPILGHSSDLVWVPDRGWEPFDKAYPPPVSVAPVTAATAPAAGAQYAAGTSGAGIVECATEDTSMVPEQKAFLDAIAVAEATTRIGIEKGVSSYRILVGGGIIDDLSRHPSKAVGTKYGSSKAAGRYQNLHVDSFTNGFSEIEQDRKAWDLAAGRGITIASLQSSQWETIWNKAATHWAGIRYTTVISPDSKWHTDKGKVNNGVVDSSCGSGHSYYCQGSGHSHEQLTKAYNLCLKHYKGNGQEGGRYYINNGQPVPTVTSPAPSTPPPAGTPPAAAIGGAVRFAAIGDYGSGNENARKVSVLVKSWFPEFIITLGDNDYGKSGNTMDKNIGQFYGEYIKKPDGYSEEHGGKSPVNRFFPSLGNHDVEKNKEGNVKTQFYLDYFELPSSPGNERYYVVDKSPLVRLFALDSEGSDINTQKTWLQTELAKSSSCYNIVYFHQPPYTLKSIFKANSPAHGPNSDWRWVFDVSQIDAVLTGHNHNYQRFLINDKTFIINGVGGGGIYDFDNPIGLAGSNQKEINLPGKYFAKDAGYGASFITVNKNRITFEFQTIKSGGNSFDAYTYSQPCRISSPVVGTTTPISFGSMLVLGSDNEASHKKRVEGAVDLFDKYSFGSVIFSGAKIGDFIKQSQAEDMQVLFTQKMNEKEKQIPQTYVEKKSASTAANHFETSKLIKARNIQANPLLVVSDNVHVEAAAYCFKLIDKIDVFYYWIGHSSAPTAPRSDPNKIPREDVITDCKKLSRYNE